MEWGIKQKPKERFLTALAMAIKKDTTTSTKKYVNEFKVHGKSVWTVNKPYLIPNRNPLDYAIFCVLENETNSTSHPNIRSLKTSIEKEWNRLSE